MKIEDPIFLPVKPASSPVSEGGKDKFADRLQQAGALRQKEAGLQALSGLAPVAGVAPGESVGAPREMVEAVLSRLEIFQEALTRPGLTLKALSPLVQALEQDSRHLESLSRSLPADSPLRQVVEEAAALVWTEAFKFNRGDYL